MKPWRLMRFRSFRLRIALLSGVVSGVALVCFGGLTFAVMQRINLARMDEDIKEFAHKHLTQPHGPRHWERVGDSLSFFLGDEEEDAFILLVKDRDGTLDFISANWPEELATDDFPSPDAWGSYPGVETPPRPRGRDYSNPYPPGSRGRYEEQGPPDRPQARLVGPFAEQPPPPVPLKTPEFSTREAGEAKWRIGMMGNPDLTIALGLSMRRLDAEMAQVRHALLVVLPIALLFVAAGAWWMSQRALKPIEAISGTIRRVKAMGFDQRILAQEEDREFSALIADFDDMMDWIEKSFHQAIRFSADASHELKTPLTVLQTQLEEAVDEAEPGSDEQRRYVTVAEELQRLKTITQKLLLLARIDAGELRLNLRPLNLSRLTEGIVEDTETLAPHLEVDSELCPNLWVMGDEDLMKQVIQNLAANAVKFNCEGGSIQFKLHTTDQQVQLTIANSGRGIPPEDHDKIFTRFYRADKARTRRVSGAGLGLSLAREIVRGHHGQLVLEHSSGDTTVFSLTVPTAS